MYGCYHRTLVVLNFVIEQSDAFAQNCSLICLYTPPTPTDPPGTFNDDLFGGLCSLANCLLMQTCFLVYLQLLHIVCFLHIGTWCVTRL